MQSQAPLIVRVNNATVHWQHGVQVKSLVFHPVQPWLAYADVNQAITVWDWSSQQVCVQLRSHDSCACQTTSRALRGLSPRVSTYCDPLPCNESPFKASRERNLCFWSVCRWFGRLSSVPRMRVLCRMPCYSAWQRRSLATMAKPASPGQAPQQRGQLLERSALHMLMPTVNIYIMRSHVHAREGTSC